MVAGGADNVGKVGDEVRLGDWSVSTKRAPGCRPGATVRGAHAAPGQTSQRALDAIRHQDLGAAAETTQAYEPFHSAFPRWPRRAVTSAGESARKGKGFVAIDGAADGRGDG